MQYYLNKHILLQNLYLFLLLVRALFSIIRTIRVHLAFVGGPNLGHDQVGGGELSHIRDTQIDIDDKF